MNNLEDFKYIKGFGGGGGGASAAPTPTAAYEDAEGFVYDGLTYNVYQFAKVKDLLSEGPIGGLLEGQYSFSGQVGDLGFKKVTYNEYPSVVGSDGESKYLRSVQWNQTPLLDSQDKYNFQQINIQATNGTPEGTSSGGEFDNVSYIRSIGERLRGPNLLASTEDETLDYQRTYRILNRECKKISLNFRISSLYVSLKYQDLKPISEGTLKIEGVTSANQSSSTFTLDPASRDVELTNGQTLDAGVGSVIRHNFKIRIRISPIYKEGYNSNSAVLDLISDKAKVIDDSKDLAVTVDTFPQIFELESKGKITQGYSKQIIFDTSSKFLSLNENENWLGWDISVLKITPEDTYSSRASFINLESITEIYSSSFRYTNSAIVTSKFNAAYFSKIPERSYDVKLLKVKVPANYDPITKTYGNTTPLSITATNSFAKTDKVITTDFFVGENNVYTNSDNVNPPITDGLIAQFDASNASLTTSTGSVTNWPNTVAGSTIKCVLGNGTYASPNGSANKPTYGSTYSEQSPNGTYGVSFTTTQKARFVYQTETSPLADASNNYTVFAVCKWHDSATNTERNRIISSYSLENTFVLGFDGKFNNAFTVGSQIYGVMPVNFYQFNRSNYWNDANDTNTYIVGTSVSNLKDVNIFWQNTNYFVRPINAVAAPKGLAINSSASTSRCTVFEILVYNKALSKSDGIKIRNWLNKKWNLISSNLSYSTSVAGSYNTNVLNVASNTYLKMPLKTLCANGQRTKAYSYAGGSLATSDYYEFDLIPQRYWKNWKTPQNFSLKDQGFCSFYCDFFIKLGSIGDGNYTLIHRSNQFNLSMTISGENVSLILTVISPNESKNYTITKALDPAKYSTTKLKENFTRISFYILPKVVKPSISYTTNASKVNNINISDRTWTNDYITVRRATTDGNEKALAQELKDFYLVKAVSFKEDTSYSSDINNLPETCYKYIYCNFNSATQQTGGKFSTFVPVIERRLTKEYFPDILNAEIDVLVNLEKQIQCNINISNYAAYQTLCVGALYRPATDPVWQNEINQRAQIAPLAQEALNAYNKQEYHKTFDGSSTSVSLSSSQSEVKVLIPLAAGQIYDAVNTKTGPFIPSYFITNNNQIEIFTSPAGFGGKIQGYADSIRVNQIDFDRLSLSKAFARNLFSEGLSRKTTVYDVAGVLPYSTSNDYWDGEFKTEKEWTDNPAWCFYDLLTNKRYGVGNYVTENDVDKWSLYQIAKYCDELVSDGFGGVEPRFTCNVYLQTQDDALKVLSDMASVFRGMFYYSNGFIYAINDMPEDTPIYSFTNSNVSDGNFTYESTSLKDRNSVVYIRYIDKNNFYKPAVEYVENIEAVRKFGFKETELTAFGCTSRGQAQRLGRWLLASEYNETETVSFEAGPECVYLKPGDVIKVYDYNRKYKTVGGRLNNINISGDTNVTTGILTLDRKLDFNFSGNQNYKLTILSPKYNLDPSFKDAAGDSIVTSNLDYNDYRKPLTNSFIVGSGNLITGQYYDSIRITGLAPVMASGLNVTGLSYFTGASGMSPKSITWALENSGNLNGSTDSDYDFYRVFRIQESTEGSNYTVIGSQMYHLKYAQIESGLNITPAKPPAPEASAPSRALFTLGVAEANGVIDQSKVLIEIFYDSSIKDTTIGFKIFNKAFYGSDFNPNSSSDFKFVPIDIYESYVNTVLDKSNIKGSIRIYGANINNSSPLTYVEASNSQNSNELFVSPVVAITYDDVNTSSSITLNNKVYAFTSPIDLTKAQYFQSTVPSQIQSVKPPESLSFNIPLQFIKNPNKFNNLDYPYRIAIIPEKVDTKDAFGTVYNKYLNVSNWEDYLTFDEDQTSDNIYNYKTSNVFAKYRNFSLAIDKMTFTDVGMKSTSNDFKNVDGFLLVTYDNQDADLKTSLNAILKDTRATYSIVTSQGSNRLKFTIQQDTASSFINTFYLLLMPSENIFEFGKNSINHNPDGSPFSVNDNTGKEIVDSHFITISNNQSIFNFNDLSDDNGKGFDSTQYNAYLIAVDSFMFAWQFNSNAATARNILDYYSSFIDKDNNIGKIYPQISDPIVIKQESSTPLSFSLESVLKDADTRYLHFTINKTILTENIFDTSVNTLPSPAYAISRKSVIYKPTTNANLAAGAKDDRVLSSDPDGTMAYYKLSLQNRDNIPNASLSPKIPTGKRAYVLNGNKIFTRALVPDANTVSLRAVESETANAFKSKAKITNSSFGEGNEEFFDISITRLTNSTFTGNIKSLIPDYTNTYLIPINASNSSTEENAKSNFNSLLNDGLLNSSFNAINVTPENNFSELGVNTKNVQMLINAEPNNFTVYTINQQTANSFNFGIANSSFYAGVPVLENESLSIFFTIGSVNKTKAIKVYCFIGEDFVASEVDKTQIIPGDDNIIKVTLKNVPYANYYANASSYSANASITNPTFWKFKSAKNLAFAHLSARSNNRSFPLYNFHIQALELSVVITY
jgi:hypothetical protein